MNGALTWEAEKTLVALCGSGDPWPAGWTADQIGRAMFTGLCELRAKGFRFKLEKDEPR